MSQLRKDPVTKRWVIIADSREHAIETIMNVLWLGLDRLVRGERWESEAAD